MRALHLVILGVVLAATLGAPGASATAGRIMVYCDSSTCGMTTDDLTPGACYAPPGYGALDICAYCDSYTPATSCLGWALAIGTGSVSNMDLGSPQVSVLCGGDPNCFNVWVNRGAQPISPDQHCDQDNAYVGIEKPQWAGNDIYLCLQFTSAP